MTQATVVEVHHFVSEDPHFEKLCISPKKRFWRELKVLPDEQFHGLSVQRKILQHIKIPTIFGEGAPSSRKRFSQKKKVLPLSPHINRTREKLSFKGVEGGCPNSSKGGRRGEESHQRGRLGLLFLHES